MILTGVPVSGGQAIGTLLLLSEVDPPAESVDGPAEPTEEALQRLGTAVEASAREIADLASTVTARLGASHASIIEAQLMVLDDPEWIDPVREQILAGVPAAAAVWSISSDIASDLAALEDDYLRARAADIVDVAQRVLRHLTGVGGPRAAELRSLTEGPIVLGARELTPSDTVDLDPAVVVGILTELGARTSHSAIIARQLGIPAVVAVPEFTQLARSGITVTVDGDTGVCVLDPDEHHVQAVRAAQTSRRTYEVVRDVVCTADGVEIRVSANAASPDDVRRAVDVGADGIGLFRSEFLFMSPDGLPDEEQQFAVYSAAAAACGGRPIVFRTLDVGGDKPAPGLQMDQEDNPFLGLRGIRLVLQHQQVFCTQLRALARTAELHPNVAVMIPMVSGLEELDEVRAILDEIVPSCGFRLGAMVEVPSCAVLVRDIAAEVEFLSVGTNDLTAYVLAADRGNPHVQYLYSEYHPAVLRVLRDIVRGAEGTPLSVCGEFASDLRSLPLLAGLGYRHLSIAAPLIPQMKDRIARISVTALAPIAERVTTARRRRDAEDLLTELAAEAFEL